MQMVTVSSKIEVGQNGHTQQLTMLQGSETASRSARIRPCKSQCLVIECVLTMSYEKSNEEVRPSHNDTSPCMNKDIIGTDNASNNTHIAKEVFVLSRKGIRRYR